MEQRTLGRTGLTVSTLSLGTVELGLDYGVRAPGEGRPSHEEGIRIVHGALDAGINFIDTARVYGDSERVLGKALRDRRDGVVLATKVMLKDADGSMPRGDDLRQRMIEGLETSLLELNTDHVDVWQIHSLDSDTLKSLPDLAVAFDDARRSGKARYAGCSVYGDRIPQEVLDADFFDVIQVPFSVFDQRLSDSFFPRAAARNVGIVTRSVLLKGALTESAEHLPDHLSQLRDRSREFRRLVSEAALGLTPAQVAIAFAAAQGAVSSVLVGIRDVEEVRENVRAVEQPLPEALLETLRELGLDDPDLLNPGTWGFL